MDLAFQFGFVYPFINNWFYFADTSHLGNPKLEFVNINPANAPLVNDGTYTGFIEGFMYSHNQEAWFYVSPQATRDSLETFLMNNSTEEWYLYLNPRPSIID